MPDTQWNPWKITAIGMALVMATALVTGLVVANWTGTPSEKAQAPVATTTAQRPTAPAAAAAPRKVAQAPAQPSTPPQVVVDACNQYASSQSGSHDKMDVVKDAALGAVVGAAVGAAGGAIADGGKGAGKGAAIGGVIGAGGGTLYGLNEGKKHDERYREAYATCMRSRGYTG